MILVEPAVKPPVDADFRPASLSFRAFQEIVDRQGGGVPLRLALEREEGLITVFETRVLDPSSPDFSESLWLAERVVKTLLWARGGWRVVVGGPRQVGEHLQSVYSPSGARAFDQEFLGDVYEHPFTVEVVAEDAVPDAREQSVALGRHLEGCRIGLDLGASDRKVAAVIDGEAVYTEEVVWDPRNQQSPAYHYHHVEAALHAAAAHMPRVDALGVSSAGIYIDNRVRVASLFRGIPKDLFDSSIAGMFLRIGTEWAVPIAVANDGDVTALAGAMDLGENAVLGIALGSSEAGGFVDPAGNITGWLNELAFVPIEWRPDAPADDWAKDGGCGSQFFSQEAVFRLCPKVGIDLDKSRPKADQLKQFQDLLALGDDRAVGILETIGCYMGYGLAYYDIFYRPRHVLILGRVTSGDGGHIILDKARQVLAAEFPDVAARLQLHLPEEEAARRVGQAVAAASLPEIGGA
jgi:predicted NBD/HSP70 family sugar kinase